MELFSHSNTRFFWEAFGKPTNPPVLILHGLGSPPELSFYGLIPSLITTYYLIAPHMRGQAANLKYGLDDPRKAFTMDYPMHVVRDIVSLLDHLTINSIPIIGYSLGGAITILLSKTYPNRVVSQTLLAPGIQSNESEMLQNVCQLMQKDLLPNLPRNIQPWLRPIIRYYGDKYHIMGEAEYYGIKEGIFGFWVDTIKQAVPQVHVQTQIIHGEKDSIVPVSASQLLHKQWSNSQLHVLPDAGHGLHNESVQIMHVINTYIQRFLTKDE